MQPLKIAELALTQYLRHFSVLIVATYFLAFGSASSAVEKGNTAGNAIANTVAVLLSEPGGYYREFFDALNRSLEENSSASKRLRVLELANGQGQGQGRPDEASLAGVNIIIAVGVQAMRIVASWEGVPPILNVLVPKASYEKLLAENANNGGNSRRRTQFSAIFIDPPPARQARLIHQILPGKRRISALLGPDSSLLLPPLRLSFRQVGLELLVEEVMHEKEIIPALARLMNSSDAFLALPDSVVFTRDTIRSVLLTAYRYQRPLIGFSQAYVTSGALAATFSTPQQIARQTAELLKAMPPGSTTLTAPLYPEYFSVAVNRSVARALTLDIPDDASLQEALSALPESKQCPASPQYC
jgi:putative tryptophan/tyrosine transport system substrate-binding protein